MAPPKPKTSAERRTAASAVLEVLKARALPPAEAETLAALSTVKGMFTRIFLEDQWDWFTVMGQLGYPSRTLANVISKELGFARSAIRDRDETGFRTAQLNLHQLPTRRCLRAFLGQLVLKDETDAGWLYILSPENSATCSRLG